MPATRTRPTPAGPRALPLDGVPLRAAPELFTSAAAHRVAVATAAGPVHIRPVTPLDAEGVQRLVRGLSAASSFRRFHTPVRSLTPRQLAGIIDVDHRRRESLIAVEGRRVVGLAQYAGDDVGPGAVAHAAGQAVEVAVVVADDRHRAGIGRALMAALLDAAARAGHPRATALVQADNRPVLDLLRTAGRPVALHRDGTVVEVAIDLALDLALDIALDLALDLDLRAPTGPDDHRSRGEAAPAPEREGVPAVSSW